MGVITYLISMNPVIQQTGLIGHQMGLANEGMTLTQSWGKPSSRTD